MCSHAAVIQAQLHSDPLAGDPSSNKLLHNSSLSTAEAAAVTKSCHSLLTLALSHTHVCVSTAVPILQMRKVRLQE